MKYPTLLALAVLAWPALSLAQSTPEKTSAAIAAIAAIAADPGAPVPAVRYRSALEHSPRGVVQDSEDWRAANARVGQFARGHSDILKAEQAQGTDQPAVSPSTPAPGARR